MPRVEKWLYPDVQKHKRNAEYLEEGYGRKGGDKAGGKRAWAAADGRAGAGAGRKSGHDRRTSKYDL
ncbi:MAG: hypothetical protein EOO28_33555 [Comamonadaceae bacterium]|nr:MAG: hypothetical protein EOO28_33555 [Comamonadaceae bacterium]